MNQVVSSPSILGQAIKAARLEAKLTQSQLAEKTGLRQGTISDIENGTQRAKLDTLFIILSALNLDMHLQPKSTNKMSEW
ncbi:transcriptional regulator, XRE family [Denitrovibrio acetiphilus DSM 12809]|jgi:HTH-type transcriptional regulator/antitoxin HipB|uniref:Transcriptional regulator, XRE family n=1 Tax=Denitrovibrio acetiphilus (strain DSM 12809 / NBRC 114555 / N2460) TaxID=522772 RepID=D4H550_DENA2|nr:helix-turn-helix transcriptional regulator [Denitrovibrio acetiphilus]ADD69406.1 transcriptional regulator, XRE family [Denitrovibrio acetiphilus DSM 12809]